MKLEGVLFDLDGTLADTAPDLAAAVNAVLVLEKRAPLPFEAHRPWVSHGARAMIRNAFPDLDEERQSALSRQMVAYYRDHIADHTRLFPGMAELLDQLDQRAMPWGVVTNKMELLTQPLMRALNLEHRSRSTVSGDTLAEKKPHPLPILHACEELALAPSQVIYVGDAQRDIEAGQRAGTPTAAALFGYLGTQDQPESWGADWLLEHASDLHRILFPCA